MFIIKISNMMIYTVHSRFDIISQCKCHHLLSHEIYDFKYQFPNERDDIGIG